MTENNMPELKPCPFCGGEASDGGYVKYGKPLKDIFWEGGLPITEAFFCNCISCGVRNIQGAVGHQSRAEAIAAWNTRSDLATPAPITLADALALPEIKALVEAAQAVADRWDGPQWAGCAENLRHTGEYIDAVGAALAALKGGDA